MSDDLAARLAAIEEKLNASGAEPEKLTPTRAAAIAREHGLSMSDAASLRGLAETVAEAEEIAKTFASDNRQASAKSIADSILGNRS